MHLGVIMFGWKTWCGVVGLLLCLATAGLLFFWSGMTGDQAGTDARAQGAPAAGGQPIPSGDSLAAVERLDDPARPKLPETEPPPDLPIMPWGHRDLFPVIRNPWYVSARVGDTLLLDNEPVLGLVIGNQARAYSTNQLNEHEMVIDEISGTPVLVSY